MSEHQGRLATCYFAGYNAGLEAAAKIVEKRGADLVAHAVDVKRTTAAIREAKQ